MYYHINDIIFLVRFPQFVGSPPRDVWTTAYWRGHPPTTSPLSALGLLHYRLSYRRKPFVQPSPCRPTSRSSSVSSIYCATASIKNVLLVIMYASFIDWNTMRYGSIKWGIWVTEGVRRMAIDFGSCVRSLINSSLGTKTHPVYDFPVFLTAGANGRETLKF